MASFHMDIAGNRALLTTVITLVLVLSQPGPAVARFKDLVTSLCSRTLEMDACKNCLLSDHSIESEDIPRLTYSIVFCIYSQATYGHQHADGMAQNATAAAPRRALRHCSESLMGASNRLWDTLMMLETKHYEGAYENLKRSQWSVVSCEDAFEKFAGGAPTPSTLLDDMTLVKQLCDVAQYFFHLILNLKR